MTIPGSPWLLFLLLFPAAFCGCATQKFNPAHPIEEGFTQDGEKLDRGDLIEKLSLLPDSEQAARRSKAYGDWGFGLGIPGGLLFGFEIAEATHDNASWPLFGLGAASWATGLVLELLSDAALEEAAEAFNHHLGSTSARSGGRASPFVSWKPAGASASSGGWVAGIRWQW